MWAGAAGCLQLWWAVLRNDKSKDPGRCPLREVQGTLLVENLVQIIWARLCAWKMNRMSARLWMAGVCWFSHFALVLFASCLPVSDNFGVVESRGGCRFFLWFINIYAAPLEANIWLFWKNAFYVLCQSNILLLFAVFFKCVCLEVKHSHIWENELHCMH